MFDNRFFIDRRSGVIAVRDRKYTDPDYSGLHSDTPGVVKSWSGFRVGNHWELHQKDIAECEQFLNDLISGKIDYCPEGYWTQYICECGENIKYDYNYSATCKCGAEYEW